MDQEKTNKFEENKLNALQAIEHLEIQDARDASGEINFSLNKLLELPDNNGQEIEEYLGLLVRLKLVRLPLLKEEEVNRFIKESVLEALNATDVDIIERVETRQLIFPRGTSFEMVNQPIMEALHENIEEIGDEKIFVTGSRSSELPTVKNWLLDYDRTYGTEPQQDLKWLEYAKKNAVTSRLNTSQADTLRKLLKFYEWMKREHEIE